MRETVQRNEDLNFRFVVYRVLWAREMVNKGRWK